MDVDELRRVLLCEAQSPAEGRDEGEQRTGEPVQRQHVPAQVRLQHGLGGDSREGGGPPVPAAAAAAASASASAAAGGARSGRGGARRCSLPDGRETAAEASCRGVEGAEGAEGVEGDEGEEGARGQGGQEAGEDEGEVPPPAVLRESSVSELRAMADCLIRHNLAASCVQMYM